MTTSALIAALEQLLNTLESRGKKEICSSQTPTVDSTYCHPQLPYCLRSA